MAWWKWTRKNGKRGQKSFSQPALWSPQHPLYDYSAGTGPDREVIEGDFLGRVQKALKSSGPIYAVMQSRALVFSEARLVYRRFNETGRPVEIFRDESLNLLENPWPAGTTGELLTSMLQDVDLAGNWWGTRADDAGHFGDSAKGQEGERIVRLRPDWVTLVIGQKGKSAESSRPFALDSQVLGILYQPRQALALGSTQPLEDAILLLPTEVAHFSPSPDPEARFRGMSWMTPILTEIAADIAATTHKKKFFDNSATPGFAVTFDKETSSDAFNQFVEKFQSSHKGAWNAYKTLFLMGGADLRPMAMDFKQMEFTQTIGKGESRIAAAAGVPPSWVGFSEGLQGSALNSNNFSAARRRFADGTIRPLWRMACASLSVLIEVPEGAQLWFDDRDISFLREDEIDRAEIFRDDIGSVNTAILAGYDPDAIIEAVRDRDLTKMIGTHTGLVSVQMQPPVHEDDGKLDKESDEANITNVQSLAVSALAATGKFTPESIVEAVEANDMSLLEVDPMAEQMAQAALEGAEGANEESGARVEESGSRVEEAGARTEESGARTEEIRNPKPKPAPKPAPGSAKPPASGGGNASSSS